MIKLLYLKLLKHLLSTYSVAHHYPISQLLMVLVWLLRCTVPILHLIYLQQKNYLSEIIEPSLTTHFSRHHFTFAMYSVSVALLVSVYVCRGFGGWGW